MFVVLLVAVALTLLFGPGLWVQRVLKRYSTNPGGRYSLTGAATARQLLDESGLRGIQVEESKTGDHYDPDDKIVRLTPDKFSGRSLTAVTVAAHEVGHALQDRDGYAPLKLRSALVRAVRLFEKLGAIILFVGPILAALTSAPRMGLLVFFGGLLSLGTATVVHLVTLPTEVDASFKRALPLLRRHQLLQPGDEAHARRLLRAAALTYFSASLMSLLNIARWFAILRR